VADPSGDQARNVELAREGLESWIEGDREAAIATFREDIEVFVPPELGNAGSYRGLEQFRSWFEAWDEAWSDFTMEVIVMEPVGERHVIAEIDSAATGTSSGIEVGNTLGWVLGVREGRLEYLSLQPNLEAARAHAQEREAGGTTSSS
jgi:ketosteroid isomerase-like protein